MAKIVGCLINVGDISRESRMHELKGGGTYIYAPPGNMLSITIFK